MVAAVDFEPPKLVFVNILSGDEVAVQFNPTDFTEAIAAKYDDQSVSGQSHEPSQFVNTQNFTIELKCTWRAYSPEQLVQLNRARRHMLSWCYPRNISPQVVGGGAPRILVAWPGMLSLECSIRNVRIQHKRFNRKAQSVEMDAFISIREIRDFRITFDEVAEDSQLRLGSTFGMEGDE